MEIILHFQQVKLLKISMTVSLQYMKECVCETCMELHGCIYQFSPELITYTHYYYLTIYDTDSSQVSMAILMGLKFNINFCEMTFIVLCNRKDLHRPINVCMCGCKLFYHPKCIRHKATMKELIAAT